MSTSNYWRGGRCALVNGASSGLGRHFARTFAEAGASVVVAARTVNMPSMTGERVAGGVEPYCASKAALLRLVSDAGSFMTGSVRAVEGGHAVGSL